MIATVVLTLFAIIGADSAAEGASTNRWAEPARGILAQRCGRCHLPNLPTSVPRALAVFDLTEEPWYGRLTTDQFDSLLKRLHATKNLPTEDGAALENFVRCARDGECPPAQR